MPYLKIAFECICLGVLVGIELSVLLGAPWSKPSKLLTGKFEVSAAVQL